LAAGQLQNKVKLCCLMHAIHHGRSLMCLIKTVQFVIASRPYSGFRSSSNSSIDYCLPRLCKKFGVRAFSHAAPSTWNALPDNICAVAIPAKFQKPLNYTILALLLTSVNIIRF